MGRTSRPLGPREVFRMAIKDAELLTYIWKYKIEHGGVAPSMREMIDGTTIVSTSMVSRSIGRLVEKGKITYSPGVARSIQVKGLIMMEDENGKQN